LSNHKLGISSIVLLSFLLIAIEPAFADATVPSAPTGISASAVSPTQVNLFWNAPSGFTITNYKIEYKVGGGSYTTLVTTTGTTATSTNYSHTGLTTGIQYSYKIYAINSIGMSVASVEVSAIPSTSSVGSLPGSPIGLVATPISPTQTNLSWNAPSNGGYPITGYRIEYRIGAGSYSDLVQTTGSAETTYSHTGMTAGQVYVYRVYAITSFGQSEKPSAETTINLKPASSASSPGAPFGLSATAVSPTQVNLSWSAPSNNGGYQISGYKIEVKKGSAAYSILSANTGNSTTTYSHTGLTTGTQYSYKIYAINSIGTGTASQDASATPTAASALSSPAPPTGLVATSASASQINLSWSAPSNNGGSPITGYKIEYMLGSSGIYSTLVANTANTAITYSHTGLTTGQVYAYRVSAINSAGASNPSTEASATPTTSSQITTNSAPGAPTNLVAMSVSGTQINLSWSAPSNTGGSPITGYKIESKKGAGSFEVVVPNTATTITSYAHTGLTTGTQYYYRVYAINSIGTSGPSGESSSSPKETTVPTLTGFAIAPTKIYLSWTAPSQTYKQSIGGYKIEEKLGTDSYKVINDNTGSVNSYTISNLIAGKTYTYAVTALFTAGSSPRSNELSVTPTSTSVPPAGFSINSVPTPILTPTKPTGTDPQSVLKAQQEEVKRKAQEAREAMLKQSGKSDSEKAKALREEAKKANEKANQDALAAKQKLIADKKAAAIKAQQEKIANQTSKVQPSEVTSKKPKTLEEARKLADEAKQKALEKANIDVKKSSSNTEEKQKALDAAKSAAWEKAKKALEELKAKSQK
jgi:titin